MPVSALSGLVEGLLQGNALKEKRKQDAYEKERQHATDIFQQHVQTMKEQQAQEEGQRLKNDAAEQKRQFDLNYALRQSEQTSKDTDRDARRKLGEDSLNAKTDKERRENYLKAIALGYYPEQATMMSGYTPSAAAPAPQIGGGAGSALDILNSAGQNAPPLPGGAPGGLTPPAIQSLIGTPPGTLMPPAATGPRATSPIGQAPAVAAGINAKNASAGLATANTGKAVAQTALITSKQLEVMHDQALKDSQTKLNEAKTGKTHADESYKKAMMQPDLDYKHALINLTVSKQKIEDERKLWMKTQEEHTKIMDALRADEKDINRVGKEGTIIKNSQAAANKLKTERWAQEDHLNKLISQQKSYKPLADLYPKIDTLEKESDKATVRTAHEMMPHIQNEIDAANLRIKDIAADELEARSYAKGVTEYMNKNGVVSKALTDKERAAADKAAEEARKAAGDAAAESQRRVDKITREMDSGSHFLDPVTGAPSNPLSGLAAPPPIKPRTAPAGTHPKVQAVAPGKTSGNSKTGKLKTMSDAELDALRKKLEHHQ